ncbi:SRPBCC family protein [Streptomyces sp. NBC_00873]|uniref:SRPBCC family protein n=1 Tax=unclassified Streptomyces TaxID=2593676 RepID=UPI00386B7F8B|nr:SRPBCC family protein [Streptomyces sp. NBC_00873]WTA48297.1 SRPBCC family protein [Streptomyces sp. NBC_00842]
MAAHQRQDQKERGSGLDQLKDELAAYLGAQAQEWMGKAGDKVADLTDQLSDTVEGGGLSRILGGESPVKALVSAKAKSVKDKVVGKVKDAFTGGGGGGGGNTKVTNIVETLDVGLPVRTVYDHWTQFEDFSSFTKGVRSVSQADETTSDWKVKVGPSARSWHATVQEQVPDDRIVWTSDGSKGSTRGAVSFHELTPNLTRIVLVVEYYPSGFFEKTGNLWRAQGRRLRLDLKHFGRHVTLAGDEEVEGWRGEIRDGEVVRSHEEGLEDDDTENEEYDEDSVYDEDEEGSDEEDEYEHEYEDAER